MSYMRTTIQYDHSGWEWSISLNPFKFGVTKIPKTIVVNGAHLVIGQATHWMFFFFSFTRYRIKGELVK